MINLNELTLTQIKEIQTMFGNVTIPTANTSTLPRNLGQTIIVLDRGFVYVGDTIIKGDFVYVSNCKNIRYWGTKNGLGGLRDGPKAETKLDAVGEIIAPLKSVIHFVPCKGF